MGTLQSRPDLRWRTTPARIDALAVLQGAVLAAGARATRAGGVLVYTVCTISRAESEHVVERFLQSHLDLTAQEVGLEYPHWAVGGSAPAFAAAPPRPHGLVLVAALRRA